MARSLERSLVRCTQELLYYQQLRNFQRIARCFSSLIQVSWQDKVQNLLKYFAHNGLNTLRPRQNDHHFADILKCIFLNEKKYYDFTGVCCYQGSNRQYSSNSSDNGFAPGRHQAIISTNVYWCLYAPLGLNVRWSTVRFCFVLFCCFLWGRGDKNYYMLLMILSWCFKGVLFWPLCTINVGDTRKSLYKGLLPGKIVGCACTGNARNASTATEFKQNCQFAIPACITAHASRTAAGKTFPAFPARVQPAIWLIWQEAHPCENVIGF